MNCSRMFGAASLAVAVVLLSACSGGGASGSAVGPVAPAAAATHADTHAVVSVHVRGGTPVSSAHRSARFVGKGTAGLEVGVAPHSTSMFLNVRRTFADIGPASALCHANSVNGDMGRDCSISVNAPDGSVDLYARSYDRAPRETASTGYGTSFEDASVLGKASLTDGSTTIAASGTTKLSITLNGVVKPGTLAVDTVIVSGPDGYTRHVADLPFVLGGDPSAPIAIPLIVVPHSITSAPPPFSVSLNARDFANVPITGPGTYASSGGPDYIVTPPTFTVASSSRTPPIIEFGTLSIAASATDPIALPVTAKDLQVLDTAMVSGEGQLLFAITQMLALVPEMTSSAPAKILVIAAGVYAYNMTDVPAGACTNIVSYTVPTGGYPSSNGRDAAITVSPLHEGSCKVRIAALAPPISAAGTGNNSVMNEVAAVTVTLTVTGTNVTVPIHIPG